MIEKIYLSVPSFIPNGYLTESDMRAVAKRASKLAEAIIPLLTIYEPVGKPVIEILNTWRTGICLVRFTEAVQALYEFRDIPQAIGQMLFSTAVVATLFRHTPAGLVLLNCQDAVVGIGSHLKEGITAWNEGRNEAIVGHLAFLCADLLQLSLLVCGAKELLAIVYLAKSMTSLAKAIRDGQEGYILESIAHLVMTAYMGWATCVIVEELQNPTENFHPFSTEDLTNTNQEHPAIGAIPISPLPAPRSSELPEDAAQKLLGKVTWSGKDNGYFVLEDKTCWKVTHFVPRWRTLSEWWNDVQVTPAHYETSPRDWNQGADVLVYPKAAWPLDPSNASNQDDLRKASHFLVDRNNGNILLGIASDISEFMNQLSHDSYEIGYAAGTTWSELKALASYNKGYLDGKRDSFHSGFKAGQEAANRFSWDSWYDGNVIPSAPPIPIVEAYPVTP